ATAPPIGTAFIAPSSMTTAARPLTRNYADTGLASTKRERCPDR
ncbi:hypothetical protein NPIL_683841, partial [Nephila pilipes]